ncbi:hypothetical protein PanWU01x14_236380 [Parasponia andersonii]|uniref:Uncharacterized protein n=1 Tax=Parasponia andersonii TaxID=3476 RepID=A0A2P5BIB0_PARAD|nr:hypothetical protein PanWU01x14_236380 [Parasponia andersonii]
MGLDGLMVKSAVDGEGGLLSSDSVSESDPVPDSTCDFFSEGFFFSSSSSASSPSSSSSSSSSEDSSPDFSPSAGPSATLFSSSSSSSLTVSLSDSSSEDEAEGGTASISRLGAIGTEERERERGGLQKVSSERDESARSQY